MEEPHNPDTEGSQSEPTITQNPSRFARLTDLAQNSKRIGLVIGAGIVLIAVSAGAYFFKHSQQSAPISDRFAVITYGPQGDDANLDAGITIGFNRKVHTHEMDKYVEIIPQLVGEFEQGTTPQDIVFRPSQQLPPATKVTLKLKAGLPSETGEILTEDFFFGFTTKALDSSITFTQDGISAKFMSFQADRGVDLDVTVGSEVAQPNARIFKVAKVDSLLKSFAYKPSDYGHYTNYGDYVENVVDSSEMEMVKDITNVAEIKRLSFNFDPGLYILEARDGNKILNTVWISINTIGIHFRQDDQKIYFAAQNLKTGLPEQDIQLSIYQMDSKPKLVQKQTLNSIIEIPYVFPKTVDIVLAQKGNEIVVIPVNVPNTQADIRVYDNLNTKKQVFLYTERPIYQPGDKLYYRGLVRLDNDALYEVPPAGSKIRIKFEHKGAPTNQIVTLQPDGTFFGEIQLPSDVDGQNYYNLLASTNLDPNNEEYLYEANIGFEIIKYQKPDFGLSVKTAQAEYVRGDTAKTTITGTYFDGRPMANEKVNYVVYYREYYETEKAVYNESFKLNGWGGMCGIGFDSEYYGQELVPAKEVTLDKNGQAVVEFKTDQLPMPYSKELVIVAQKKDSNNNDINSASTSIVHGGEYNIFLRPNRNAQIAEAPFAYSFYAETAAGQKLGNQSFEYGMYEIKYENNKEVKNKISGGSVKTNSDGVGTVSGAYPKMLVNGSHSFVITGKDSKGNVIENSQYVYVSEKPTPTRYNNTVLSMQSKKNNFQPGDTIELDVESPANIRALVTMERGRVYAPQWIDIKKGKSTISLKVDEQYVPSITPTFSFFYNGTYFIEGLSLNVPALGKVLNVEIQTNKTNYAPGESAYVTIKTKDATGKPVPAKVGIGIVDKAIYALRKNATSPIHSSFYYFRDRQTNASSSLTWVTSGCECGGGGGGGEDFAYGKDIDTLYWDPNIQTGADGTAIVSVPVGNSRTTWKILIYGSTNTTDLGQGEAEFLVN